MPPLGGVVPLLDPHLVTTWAPDRGGAARLLGSTVARGWLVAAGGSFVVMLVLAVNAACIAGISAIVVRKQPGWAAVGVIALWGMSVVTTAVLAWQIGRLMTAFGEVYG